MTLSEFDVLRIANRYIGVSDGRLGDFSYRTHADFYPEYCGLDIDPNEIEGTTRKRFIHILSNASPRDQAKIIRGVLDRFPVLEGPDATRTPKLAAELSELADRLMGSTAISTPSVNDAFDAAARALSDAQTLLDEHGPGSAVDRVHTALHAYLRDLCEAHNINPGTDDGLTSTYKAFRTGGGAAAAGPLASSIESVLVTLANVVDKLNEARNHASLAHPNPALERPEAALAVHAGLAILHYLNDRERRAEGHGTQ